MKTLILGGVKSGKSKLAEQQATATGKPVIYIATAMKSFEGITDTAMQARIDKHKEQRPEHWQLIEEPVYIADAVTTNASVNNCILIDCLTLWLTNLLLKENDDLHQAEKNKLLEAIKACPGNIILVSNETNMGIIPDSALARRFCDETGTLHQQIANECDNVILTIAGLPHILKGTL